MSNGDNTKLWEKAKELVEKSAKDTGFIKYKNAPSHSIFHSLYIQVIKLSEIAVHTELKMGKSEEEAINAGKAIMRNHIEN